MDKVPVYIIILAIVGILIVGVIIASLSTNNEKSIQSKESETKSQNNCVLLKHHKNEQQ
jgi:mannose/fructose/N-acetylgalactosamine-specific phosphotransferase system component IIC